MRKHLILHDARFRPANPSPTLRLRIYKIEYRLHQEADRIKEVSAASGVRVLSQSSLRSDSGPLRHDSDIGILRVGECFILSSRYGFVESKVGA